MTSAPTRDRDRQQQVDYQDRHLSTASVPSRPVLNLRAVARTLGGEICGRQVLAPGPGHSCEDRSMLVRPSPGAPEGFLVGSFAGDDWRECRDYVRARLGLPACTACRAILPVRPEKSWCRNLSGIQFDKRQLATQRAKGQLGSIRRNRDAA